MKQHYLNSLDAEIWDDFRSGSEPAYEFIYQTYTPILFRYGIKLSSDRELVKDAIQDLFIYLWDARGRLSTTNSIKYYLFRVIRRIIFAKLNDASPVSYTDFFEDTVRLSVSSHESLLIEEQTGLEQNEKLLKEVHLLSQRQKEAIFLRFYDNLEFHQIAEIMSISPRAVYKLIYKAVDALQKNMLISLGLLLTAHLIG